jgi:hypothetical protein
MVYAGIYTRLGDMQLAAARGLANAVSAMNVLDAVTANKGVPQRIDAKTYEAVEQSWQRIGYFIQQHEDPGSRVTAPRFQPHEAYASLEGFEHPRLAVHDGRGHEIAIVRRTGKYKGIDAFEIEHSYYVPGTKGTVWSEERYVIPSPGMLRPESVTLKFRGEALSRVSMLAPLVERKGVGTGTAILLSALFFAQYREVDLAQRLLNVVRYAVPGEARERKDEVTSAGMRDVLDRFARKEGMVRESEPPAQCESDLFIDKTHGAAYEEKPGDGRRMTPGAEAFLSRLAGDFAFLEHIIGRVSDTDAGVVSHWLEYVLKDKAMVPEAGGSDWMEASRDSVTLGQFYVGGFTGDPEKLSAGFTLAIPEFIDREHWHRFSSSALIHYLAALKATLPGVFRSAR